jgi:capsular exopolysaccharide synthesis family protein
MILRRKWIILISVLTITSAVGLYVFLTTPIFESDCKLLLIEGSGMNMLGDMALNDMMMQSLGKSDPISTQIEIIRTRPILSKVIKIVPLKNDENDFIETKVLKKALKISAVRNTNLISVSYRNEDPFIASKVINILAKVFVEQNQKLNQEDIRAAKEFIKNQLKIHEKKLNEAESRVIAFKKVSGTVSLEQETRVKILGIAEMEAELLKLDTELKGANAKKIVMKNKIRSPGARSNSFYSYWINVLEQANIKITGLSAQRDRLQEQIITVSKDLDKLPPMATKLSQLMRDQMIAKEIYTNLLSQHEEFKISEAAKISNIKIIEPAVISKEPVFPDKKKLLVLAFLAGLLLGFGVALILEYFDDSPGSIDELKKVLHCGMLGIVPWLDQIPQLFIKEEPSSLPSESLRLIQTNLKFKGIMEQKSVSLLVTSAIPEEGKSTISINLACAFAAHGKKTVLVNLDLRRPAFEKILKRSFNKGITDYIVGDASFEEIEFKDDKLKISIIPSGTTPPNPTELISSPKMSDLINKLKNEYEVIIYDTPPVTLVAESLEVSRNVDGIILVVDVTGSMRAVRAMSDLLEGKELPVMGFVLNKYRKGKSAYGYYGYGRYKND